MKTALLSVYEKKGIVEFAQQLVELGWKIIASGGTAKTLQNAGIPVQDVAELVGGGAILGHRVVTLAREVYAGLLAQYNEEDDAELKQLSIPYIDLVCVDLYPLREEIRRAGSTAESVIEKTDIGGPTLLRASAKGRRITICDPVDRQTVIDWLKEGEPDRDAFIRDLAAKAEAIVAGYALNSAEYHSDRKYAGIVGERVVECKYGENAWQKPAALYQTSAHDPLSLDRFTLVEGTAPSYNNWCDLDRALQTVTHIAAGWQVNLKKVPFIAVGAKHGNACGAAAGADRHYVLRKMLEGDLRAIFGGLVIVNFSIGVPEALVLLNHGMQKARRLLDVVVAPSITAEAAELLGRKQGKCRVLVNPALRDLDRESLDHTPRYRYVRGGFLLQPNYTYVLDLEKTEHTGTANVRVRGGMVLAWAIGSTSTSNTITLVKGNELIGNGVGQQDRVGACQLAISRAKDAGHSVEGAIAYSDSFFPFLDGPEALRQAGVRCILTSSGSVRDAEVKQFCKEHGMVLYMIPDAEARGFYAH